MKILIGGGTGFIGQHLVKQLVFKKGYDVKIISRRSGPDHITWDSLYKNGLSEYYDAIINLSGENILQPFKYRIDGEFLDKVYSSRIETNGFLSKCIENSENPPKVWISTSAIGIYEPHRHNRYTESSETSGNCVISKLCQDNENASKLSENCKTRHVISRTGVVLGRNGGIVYKTWLPFFFGLGGRIGSGKQYFPWIHIDDAVGILEHAIDNETIKGPLNVVAPAFDTNEDFTREFSKAMCRPALFPIPDFVMRTVFGPDFSKVVLEGQCVVPEKAIQSGYNFKYPDLKSACQEVSRWMTFTDVSK
ncbi:DgyrCDS1565 [Dimorphilus gyrociliatus]|uniref:DgyrCDS1565 n=1 Tax=Dimorphilus gyrociliatus TaxID=2664684 RepID=A0A7I8V9T5_9ANNE|nr:DgyrCDS1565 [Dimorphilus gyrociliatus]